MLVTLNNTYKLKIFWGIISSFDAVLSKAADDGILTENIRSLCFEGDDIEIPWGRFFESCVNLETVSIVATDSIKLNSYNFEESSVKNVIISAPKILLNDGVFMNGKSLKSVTFNGNIKSMHHHDGFPELTFKNCENLESVTGMFRGESLFLCVF